MANRSLSTDEKRSSIEKERTSIVSAEHGASILDGVHDGLQFPTERERETLRRVPDSIPWSAYLLRLLSRLRQ
ncbi:hypothetical protein C0992_000900 [Termitomyces sp. T32_za158]|nr:hypothetical protein C0992_000900 [Termitomyces sp. T32_za158]